MADVLPNRPACILPEVPYLTPGPTDKRRLFPETDYFTTWRVGSRGWRSWRSWNWTMAKAPYPYGVFSVDATGPYPFVSRLLHDLRFKWHRCIPPVRDLWQGWLVLLHRLYCVRSSGPVGDSYAVRSTVVHPYNKDAADRRGAA